MGSAECNWAKPGGRTRYENEPVSHPGSCMRILLVVYLLGCIGLLKINDSRAVLNTTSSVFVVYVPRGCIFRTPPPVSRAFPFFYDR